MESDIVIKQDLLLYRILARSVLVLVVFIISGVLLVGGRLALGLLAGGGLAIINLYWLGLTIKRGITLPASRAKRFVAMRYYIRFILTVTVISLLVTRGIVEPIPLIAGFTVVLSNTLLMTLWAAKRGEV